MKQAFVIVLSLVFLEVAAVGVVSADTTASPSPSPQTRVVKKTRQVCTTTYGGATQCRDEVIEEVVPDKPIDITEVNTGIGSVTIILATLIFGGVGLFALAQKQLK